MLLLDYQNNLIETQLKERLAKYVCGYNCCR